MESKWKYIDAELARQIICNQHLSFDYVRFCEPPVATWNKIIEGIAIPVVRKINPNAPFSIYEVYDGT